MVIMPNDELVRLLKNTFTEVYDKRKTKKLAQAEAKRQRETLYSINQVVKRLKKVHSIIKKLVEQGKIKSIKGAGTFLISEKRNKRLLEKRIVMSN